MGKEGAVNRESTITELNFKIIKLLNFADAHSSENILCWIVLINNSLYFP